MFISSYSLVCKRKMFQPFRLLPVERVVFLKNSHQDTHSRIGHLEVQVDSVELGNAIADASVKSVQELRIWS